VALRVPALHGSLIVALIALSAVAAAAQSSHPIEADRPGLADSSAVIGKGALQLETGVEWDKHDNEVTTFLPLLFRVGLSRWVEARVEGSPFGADEAGGHWENGIGTWSIGAKAVVLPEKGHRPRAGIIGRAFPPSGTGPFQSDVTTGDVRLAGDWDFAPNWSLNPNLGVGWYDAESGHFTAGLFALTLTYQKSPRVSWFVDTGGQVPESESSTTAVTVDGGVAYVTRRNWQVDLSVGTRAHGETPPHPFIAVGLAVRSR